MTPWVKRDEQEPNTVYIPTFNHNKYRNIVIPDGTDFGRLYKGDGTSLKGQELVDSIASGKIKISGIYGTDWRYKYEKKSDSNRDKLDTDRIVGIEMALDNSKACYIPDEGEDIVLDGSIADFRPEINKLLAPLPSDGKTRLWIGETKSKLTLDDAIYGMMGRRVARRIDNSHLIYSSARQLNSPLIEGRGRTNWPVRSEIWGPTDEEHIPNRVFFYFVKASSPNTHK